MQNEKYGFSRGPDRFAPVRVGEEIDVTIEGNGEKGDGIAKVNGFVIFVPNVSKGDTVKIKITKVLKKVGFAEVVGSSSGDSNTESQEDAPSEDYSEEEASGSDEGSGDSEEKKTYEDSEDF
jgi:predicted RNA-binding protein with TRAM domain